MVLPTAAVVPRPAVWGYGASLTREGGASPADTLYLRLADGPERVSGIQTLAPGDLPRIELLPEDVRPEQGASFSRSQFSGGEGLDRAHRRDGDIEFDSTRYWDSRNIRIAPAKPGEPEELQLAHTSESFRTSSQANHHMVRIGTVLYWAEGSDVKRTANPTATTPTVTSEDPEAGETATTISGLAVLGNELYAALGAQGIHKRSNAGTWTHWSNLNVTASGRIWSVKGRIIASGGATLYEAAAGADSVILKTLPTGQTWTDVIDAGVAIIAGATDGSLYIFSEESGELILRGQEDFEAETPETLGMAQGVLFVGTSQSTTAGGKIGRLWIAEVVGLRIRNAQVVREWGSGAETRDRTPRAFCATRDSAFVTVIEDGTETHSWRFHLSTAGLSRDLIWAVSARPMSVVVIDDRLFASFVSSDFRRETTTYAASGWVISPLADFHTAQPKVWVGGRLEAKLPTTQQTIKLAYSTNPDAILSPTHASWVNLIELDSTSTQVDIDAEYAPNTPASRFIAAKLTLTPNTAATTTPTAYSFTLRGQPTIADHLIRLYVNVSDVISMPGRKPLKVPGQGDRIWAELRDNWIGRHVEAHMFRPAVRVRGQVVGISTPIQARLSRGAVQIFSVVDVQGRKVSDAEKIGP